MNPFPSQYDQKHRLQMPGEEIPFTARAKIKSQSQIYRYGPSIFCLPHRPKISGAFDLKPGLNVCLNELTGKDLEAGRLKQR